MIFALEALDAKHGDSLILHFGTGQDRRFILIDGGPAGVFGPTLDRRLQQLQELRPGEPLRLELVMVSHIDDDHIRGILDMAGELRELRELGRDPKRHVRELWHNSFGDILGEASEAAIASLAARFSLPPDGPFDPQGLPLSLPAAMATASVPQGRELRDLARRLGWNANTQPVMLEREGPQDVPFGGGLALTVLGPRAERVEALQQEWVRAIRDLQDRTDPAAYAQLAALVDRSVSNLASIIVLAESENGRRILLTGDARGDDIREGLRAANLADGGSVRLDILKMPHHGSSRSVDEEFFQRVTADHYVISANGKYGNPDIETLGWLTEARGQDPYTIYFTNREGEEGLEERLSAFFREDQRRNQRRYHVRYRRDDQLSVLVNVGTEPATQ
jgi:hypothetical protein